MPWKPFLAFLTGLMLCSSVYAADGTWRMIDQGQVLGLAVTDDYVYSSTFVDMHCFDRKTGAMQSIMNPYYTDNIYDATFFGSLATADDGTLHAIVSHREANDPSSDYSYLLRYDKASWTTLQKVTGGVINYLYIHENVIWGYCLMDRQGGSIVYRFDRSSGGILNRIIDDEWVSRVVSADSIDWFLGEQIWSTPYSIWDDTKVTGVTAFNFHQNPLPGSAWGGVLDSDGFLWFGYNADTEWGLVKMDARREDGVWEKAVGITDQFKLVETKAIDTRGAVWATTSKGLARFDGTSWTVYTPQNSGLPDTHIIDIKVGRDGVVWIGTEGGLVSFTYDTPSAVDERTPTGLKILANSPNPFNPSTTITFALPASGGVSLTVYDITGRKVKELASGNFDAGAHAAMWDGCDAKGRPVSSGVYFARLVCSGQTATQKMLLMR